MPKRSFQSNVEQQRANTHVKLVLRALHSGDCTSGANSLGVSYGTLRNIKTGASNASPRTVARVSASLGLLSAEFLKRSTLDAYLASKTGVSVAPVASPSRAKAAKTAPVPGAFENLILIAKALGLSATLIGNVAIISEKG